MQNQFRIILWLWVFCGLTTSFSVQAQKRLPSLQDTLVKEDLGLVDDEFQNLFFEALAQRAIENYDKANAMLFKAEKLKQHQAVVWYEIGLNYLDLNRYQLAESYLHKALSKKPQQELVILALYKVYNATHNYQAAIPFVEQLAQTNADYYKDLSDLYRLKGAYIQALKALDSYASQTKRNSPNEWQQAIIKEGAENATVEQYLNVQIEAHPQAYEAYENLIYYYLTSDQLPSALRVAKRLAQLYPETAQLALVQYKFYLKDKKYNQAVEALSAFITHPEAENALKIQAIKDFQNIVKLHPNYRNQFVNVLGKESSGGHPNNQQLGEAYMGRNNAKAIAHLEKALAETPGNLKAVKALLVLYNKEKHYQKALDLAEQKLMIFPAQPSLYLQKGIAQNGLGQYNAAKMSLLSGVDFVVNQPQLKRRFYKALSVSSLKLGNEQEAENYKIKAANLK